MKSNRLLIVSLLLSLIQFSCSDKDKDSNSEISEIKYGTSFGECIGYCKKDIAITPDSLIQTLSGWSDTIETITYRKAFEQNSWDSVESKIDISGFFDLPLTIGCPDCADGGAEWIEIILSNGEKHKVTFEYQNETDAVKDYINDLRMLMSNPDFIHAEN
jgi:hypothetical protein